MWALPKEISGVYLEGDLNYIPRGQKVGLQYSFLLYSAPSDTEYKVPKKKIYANVTDLQKLSYLYIEVIIKQNIYIAQAVKL